MGPQRPKANASSSLLTSTCTQERLCPMSYLLEASGYSCWDARENSGTCMGLPGSRGHASAITPDCCLLQSIAGRRPSVAVTKAMCPAPAAVCRGPAGVGGEACFWARSLWHLLWASWITCISSAVSFETGMAAGIPAMRVQASRSWRACRPSCLLPDASRNVVNRFSDSQDEQQ